MTALRKRMLEESNLFDDAVFMGIVERTAPTFWAAFMPSVPQRLDKYLP